MQEYQENTQGYTAPVEKKPKTVKKIFALLAVMLVVGAGWTYYQKTNLSANAAAGKKLTDAEQKVLVQDYMAQVGKHMILPTDDQPVVATVDDPSALIKQQAFFTGSVKGDVVLIFPKTQRAVLFSPTRNKIVNAGPVIGNEQKTAAQPEVTPVQ